MRFLPSTELGRRRRRTSPPRRPHHLVKLCVYPHAAHHRGEALDRPERRPMRLRTETPSPTPRPKPTPSRGTSPRLDLRPSRLQGRGVRLPCRVSPKTNTTPPPCVGRGGRDDCGQGQSDSGGRRLGGARIPDRRTSRRPGPGRRCCATGLSARGRRVWVASAARGGAGRERGVQHRHSHQVRPRWRGDAERPPRHQVSAGAKPPPGRRPELQVRLLPTTSCGRVVTARVLWCIKGREHAASGTPQSPDDLLVCA